MRTIKTTILLLLCFVSVANSYSGTFTSTDPYPKNPKIDAINYAFKIELSDDTDEIVCELILDILFLGAGVENLRLYNAMKECGPYRNEERDKAFLRKNYLPINALE